MLRIAKFGLAALALVAASFTIADDAAAIEIAGNKADCRAHTDKDWGIPVGEGVACNFTISKAVKDKIIGTVGSALVCSPLSSAIVAVGGGPEDPMADAMATVAEAGCTVTLSALLNTYDKCGGVKLRATTKAGLHHKPSFHLHFRGCAG